MEVDAQQVLDYVLDLIGIASIESQQELISAL